MHFFTQILIILACARILGEIMERIGQPAMIGEIAAGIILGPTGLNILHRTEEIAVISEVGVFLMVVIAGMEIPLQDILKSFKGRQIIISFLAFIIPFFSGLLLASMLGFALMTSLVVGLCIAITALPVSIRILMDLGQLHSNVGRKIISIAIFDDVLALAFLGIIITAHQNQNDIFAASIDMILKLCLLVVFALVGIYIFHYWLPQKQYLIETSQKFFTRLKSKESSFAVYLIFVLLCATITDLLHFHFIIGAFFAAMLIHEPIINVETKNKIQKTTSSIAMGFMAPIFFAGIGLELEFEKLTHSSFLVLLLAVAIIAKLSAGIIGGAIAGFSKWTSITIGIGLNARGMMEIVIAHIAYQAQLINEEVMTVLVILGMLTTIITPSLLKYCFKKLSVNN